MFTGLVLSLFIQADLDACKVQPALPWCEPHVAGEPGNINAVRAIEIQARQKFSYRDDPEGQNIWRSRLNDIGSSWHGNCDQLTFTELEMLAKTGWATNKMWRVIVSTTYSDELHMIGIVQDSDGEKWVVGDVNSPMPYLWTDRGSSYRVVYSSMVSNGLVWNKSEELQQ